MNELALFAGIGGGLLGTRLLGWTPVCAVEKEPYRREVLLRRQRDGVFPLFAIWDDVRTFDGRPWRGLVDVVTAGFPCQPFSIAGKQLGEADERNMWPDTIRIIREVRPRFCFLENVPQLVRHDYFGVILGDLAEAGFDAEWDIVSAADVGAPHLRKRLWILAYTTGIRHQQWTPIERERTTYQPVGGIRSKPFRLSEDVPDADSTTAGMETHRGCGQRRECSDALESEILRQADGATCSEGAGTNSQDVSDTQRTLCESGTGGRGVREGDSELLNTNGGNENQKREIPCGESLKSSGSSGRRISWWDRDPADGPVES